MPQKACTLSAPSAAATLPSKQALLRGEQTAFVLDYVPCVYPWTGRSLKHSNVRWKCVIKRCVKTEPLWESIPSQPWHWVALSVFFCIDYFGSVTTEVLAQRSYFQGKELWASQGEKMWLYFLNLHNGPYPEPGRVDYQNNLPREKVPFGFIFARFSSVQISLK